MNEAVIAIEEAGRGRAVRPRRRGCPIPAASRAARVHCAASIPGSLPTRANPPAGGPTLDATCFVSSPTSHGTSPPTSSSIPIVGELEFDGPFGELDRRTGGELRRSTPSASCPRSATRRPWPPPASCRSSGSSWPSAGDAAAIDRETVHRLGATIERRLGGRKVERLAIWVGDLPAALGGDASAVVELLVRGVVEGHYEPKGIYLDKVDSRPAEARRAHRHRPERRRDGAGRGRRARPDHGRGRERAPARSPTGPSNDVSPEVLAEEAPATSPSATACGSTSSRRTGPPSSGWACSWRSAGAATTRPG